jgi:MscS family membrane protein
VNGRGERALKRRCAPALIALSAALSASAALTQEDRPGSSPRAALREFAAAVRKGNDARAARYLDLAHVPPADRSAQGAELAPRVLSLLDRSVWIDPDDLSRAPEGDLDDGLPRSRERIGEIATPEGSVAVELQRSLRGAATQPAWRISSQTLRAMAPLLAGGSWIEERLPESWVRARIFGIALWQWLALPLLGAATALMARLAVWLLARPLRLFAQRVCGVQYDFAASILAPQMLLVGALLFRVGLPLLELPRPVQATLTLAATALAWAAAVWLGARFADVIAENLIAHSARWGRASALNVIPLAARIVKVAFGVVAALAILERLGVNVTAVVAGLGIGGIAVALAAQKTIENLFGGISLVADHPVRVGDFCRFGERMGTVEAIGLRSTRIRTLDRTLVTVPNAEFASLQLENFSPRDRIWLRFDLRLRYDTPPEQLERVLIALRELLAKGADLAPGEGHVRLMGLGAYSLDLEVFSYVMTSDWERFLAIRERLLIEILRAVEETGARLALPAQTLYPAEPPPSD